MRGENAQSQFAPDQLLRHQLDDTRQAFENFTYIVSHDLNAPLRCIANFSQILEEKCREELDEKALHYIDMIAASSRRMQERLSGLLQYSRLDTVPLLHERLDVIESVQHALHQLKRESEEKGALIHVAPMPQLIADGERLSLLFYCLISNALKFCVAPPDITISARRAAAGWQFCVSDNGIGIEASNHELIFRMFHRLHKEEEYPGCGAGLALAHRIVELHGGGIWVESSPCAGAQFIFTLPDHLENAT